MKKNLFSYLLIFKLLDFAINLRCGEEDIENCSQCNICEDKEKCEIGDNDRCAKCEDKYFPKLNGVFCIPCDDPKYGWVGCGGKCYLNTEKILLCEKEGCKDGYYNLDGVCVPCSFENESCSKCSFENNFFKCLECVDNKKYKLENGNCIPCKMEGCSSCQFELYKSEIFNEFSQFYDYSSSSDDFESKNLIDYDNYVPFCSGECIKNYFKFKGVCKRCYIENIFGGTCTICFEKKRKKKGNCNNCLNNYNYQNGNCNICLDHEENKNGFCECYENYTLKDPYTCIPCPQDCKVCEYDKNQNKNICKECHNGFTLNHEGICIRCEDHCSCCYYFSSGYSGSTRCTKCESGHNINDDYNCFDCPANCKSCIKDSNNKIICTKCTQKYGLTEDKKCLPCPDHCVNCTWNKQDKKFTCHFCEKSNEYNSPNNYILGENNKCERCQDIQKIGGEGCIKCTYENYVHKCHICLGNTSNYIINSDDEPEKNYAYIQNDFICKKNDKYSPKYLYGCLLANKTGNIYECYKCKSGFIYVINLKKCVKVEDSNLSAGCCIAHTINLGNSVKELYSCESCKNEYNIEIYDSKQIMDCFSPKDNLYNCIEAIYIDEKKKITKCIKCKFGYDMVNGICTDNCKKGYYFYFNKCKRCDEYGNHGCESDEPGSECNYSMINNALYCNKCKKNYYKYLNQCYHCSLKDENCKNCKFDESNEKFECEECNENYQINEKTKKCEECKEYFNRAYGCVICEDKINIKGNNCHYCKPEFFPKSQSCVYCKAKTIGGPACNKCKNKNENEIICEDCPYSSYKILNPKNNKCFDCKEELGVGCASCNFNEKGDLVCNRCENNIDYYLNSNGYCIELQNQCEKIPNCANNNCALNDNNIYLSECRECEKGYYLKDNQCVKINVKNDCNFLNLLEENFSKLDDCKKICNDNNYVIINYIIDEIELLINNISKDNKILDENLKDKIKNLPYSYFCINNDGDEFKNLIKCKKSNYSYKEKKIECVECVEDYSLNSITKKCEQNSIINCEKENIGDISHPIESCKRCYKQDDILIKTENGANICETPYIRGKKQSNDIVYELEGCTSAIVSTNFYHNNYDCTSCSLGYKRYYSRFYQRYICQYLDAEKIDVIKEFDSILNTYNDLDFVYEVEKDKCPSTNNNIYLFNAGNGKCFRCNDEKVGMVGCRGECKFLQTRNNVLECLSGCIDGFIEVSKGVCESCQAINPGCINCHYDENYPSNYIGIKRKRRFVCDKCDKKYSETDDGNCLTCHQLGIDNCDECSKNDNNIYVCNKCIKGYILENGQCTFCENDKIIKNNKCIECDDPELGNK